MDRPCIATVEAFCAPGYPEGAEAILLAEVDGMESEADDDARRIGEIAKGLGATTVHECTSEDERNRAWSGRKAAFGAMGRLTPDMLCMDGTIPRKALADVLERIAEFSEKYRLGCCNVFHAGDGNLHPLIVFDCMKEGELERAEAFGADILKLCVAMGGVLTGEHGVGVEKKMLMGEMFSDTDLAQQERLKCASTAPICSTPAKCSRRCMPAWSLAACIFMRGGCRSAICRGCRAVSCNASRPPANSESPMPYATRARRRRRLRSSRAVPSAISDGLRR
jgi:glycolate oxidase